ncbi:ABC transporter permease [Litoreibacter janthinus]|uniref:Peptide/nickel transport system permease protein n=1 Tax=Litoreibacter janthinus TaxID=670154 RepID=A0A1I6H355_9RHOB|nr:ABC transporter permease [Litoreibacter janthinus]SFR48828.1 peptide/nickel transport system permease protein [Litoreibacter janthinus]
MEPLTWTGALGAYLNPIFLLAVISLVLAVVGYLVVSTLENARSVFSPTSSGALEVSALNSEVLAGFLLPISLVTLGLALVYPLAGIVTPYGTAGILGELGMRFLPVWIALIVTFFLSITYKRKLGLYGKLFDSPIGMVGFAIVMFWVFTAIFVAMDLVITHDPLGQVSGMKNKLPGTPLSGAEEGEYSHYLLGGDNLARDVFSRMVQGSQVVLVIAPAATLFAFMVGITLGLPAGYFGGKLDTVISFLANLVLAFPVILLFFLLVTPEIRAAGIPIPGTNYVWTVPTILASILFLFPLVFLVVLFDSRFFTQPSKRNLYVGLTVLIGGYLYLGLAWDADPLGLISIDGGVLIVFVSVVFVNSPTVFRIVRGLVLDIKTRDYVAAGQTRGEGPWYIMLWEILPNARGPLIVDFCLRIGYTTILLGTLGFFGLGLSSESPDWGTTINAGRRLLSIYPHPAIVPAIALMSLVLGLNLLADGLREESLKD